MSMNFKCHITKVSHKQFALHNVVVSVPCHTARHNDILSTFTWPSSNVLYKFRSHQL